MRCFLKIATEVAERTDSGRLFQIDGVQEQNALAPTFVLTLVTDRMSDIHRLPARRILNNL